MTLFVVLVLILEKGLVYITVRMTHLARLLRVVQVKSSQVKSMMLTDAGSHEPLCPYHSYNTTITFQ